MTEFEEQLRQTGAEYMREEPLALHSTFRIGGRADCAVFPKNERELIAAIAAAKTNGVRYTVIGRGSNVLFSDEGYRGMVVFTSGLCEISVDGTTVRAGCGASLTQVALAAAKHSLTGFEFAHGIPGSFGGAIYMNAGAYGGSISGVLTNSACFDPADGSVFTLSAEAHEFGNRKSAYMTNGCIVLGGELALAEGDPEAIFARMEELKEKRRASQPLEYPSAGSVFKRPEGYFAGKLIEDAGLKGTRVGGAMVSPKHAGFIVNVGGATAKDVLALIEKIRETVERRFGVLLEPEVRWLPAGD